MSTRGDSPFSPFIDFTEPQIRNFRKALLAWYRRHGRNLPWRERPSLYGTVVSEFMLQQTRVSTVLPYFERWMARFPDFTALAAAREPDLLKSWEGLGYYNRARNLHRLAGRVAAMAEIPETAEAWREFPGVGPYTAAAITSIAFGTRAACVDGNVVRILARIHSDGTIYRDGGDAARAYAHIAHALLHPARPGDHNQAMMELGATVCLRRKPLCTTCPVLPFCRAGRRGDPEAYPALAAKTITKVDTVRLWVIRGDRLLLRRAARDSGRLAGLYELPEPGHLGLDASPDTLGPVLARRQRSITRYRIRETIRRYAPAGPGKRRLPPASGLEWVPLARLPEITLSGPHRKWVEELASGEERKPQ